MHEETDPGLRNECEESTGSVAVNGARIFDVLMKIDLTGFFALACSLLCWG